MFNSIYVYIFPSKNQHGAVIFMRFFSGLFSFLSIFLILFFTPLQSDEIFKGFIPEADSVATKPTSIFIQLQRNLPIQKFEVLFNKKNITSKCRLSQDGIHYYPLFPYAAGKNEVEVTLEINGADHKQKFNFYYYPQSFIDKIEFNSDEVYYENDQFEVKFTSAPGGCATFEIEGVKDDIPMEEVKKGIYFGRYDVASGDIVSDAKIKCRVRYSNGNNFEKISDEYVNFLGSFFVVRIISPKAGEKVGKSFDITGKTRPNSIVKISAKYSLENIPVVGNLKAETGGFETKADNEGKFNLNFGLPVKLKNTKLTLCATAKDIDGNQAIPSMMVLFVE